MFRSLESNATNILTSVGVLLILLIVLFGLLHLASNHAPSPIAGLASRAANLATPTGWETNV